MDIHTRALLLICTSCLWQCALSQGHEGKLGGFVFNLLDQRKNVVDIERLAMPPWKNYFLLEAETDKPCPENPAHGKKRGTAFLTSLTREYEGKEYVVLLTCAHCLTNSEGTGLARRIRLYQAADLQRHNDRDGLHNVRPTLILSKDESVQYNAGWFNVFPGYLRGGNPASTDVGFIFVHKEYMDEIAMRDLGGMEDNLIVAPSFARYLEREAGFLAGFPLTYGGAEGRDKPTRELFTSGGDVASPINLYAPFVRVHSADATEGNDGGPFVVTRRTPFGTLKYYAVGIHCRGYKREDFGKLFPFGTQPPWVTKMVPWAVNTYRVLGHDVVVDWMYENLPAKP